MTGVPGKRFSMCVFADSGAVPSVERENSLAKNGRGDDRSIFLLDRRICGKNTPDLEHA